MRPLELAQKYMDIFYGDKDKDIGELRHLFTDDLKFNGPIYEFDSAEAYVESLRLNPPRDFQYKILKSFEDETSACLVYRFIKPGVSVPMVQIFETHKDKITSILLVFDTSVFT